MATTRLRKTFKYPSDSEGSGESHDEMDEEEQEHLLTTLRAKEATENERYILIFSLIPLTVILPFLYYLFAASGTIRSTPLLSLLAITSLLSTAYTMRFVPISASLFATNFSLDSPVETLLPYLNLIITLFLSLAAWLLKGKVGAPEGLWLFLVLPAVVLGMITVARQSMADIQAGIGELEGRRYGYKGA